ncbi:hypothetical protein KPL42_01455 [Clostridium gasigenes]|uniref:hypothetical protein n=1 Tax=Clostridium gasigenes TaxID=94869 RepID=UPI001C0D971A|nr:hypothetical protein [Clostridium gasigenes]MBU3087151.1 hypothetical protein [Clostridium gasigenes]
MLKKPSYYIKEDLELLEEELTSLEIELRDTGYAIKTFKNELVRCLDHEKIGVILDRIKEAEKGEVIKDSDGGIVDVTNVELYMYS